MGQDASVEGATDADGNPRAEPESGTMWGAQSSQPSRGEKKASMAVNADRSAAANPLSPFLAPGASSSGDGPRSNGDVSDAEGSSANSEEAAEEEELCWVGVDVGGTTISVAIVDNDGAFERSAGAFEATASLATQDTFRSNAVLQEPLGDNHDPTFICERVANLVEKALDQANRQMESVAGVGICTPGILDLQAGVVVKTANLKDWDSVPICQLLAEALGIDQTMVVLENDTNAALLAELWVGAAERCENAVLFTLGTGIGGAIYCDGRLLRGSRGQAGELGHAILVPDGRKHGSTGVRGIFEGYASCTAVVERAIADGSLPPESSLAGCPKPLECAEVFRHARQGDEYALQVVQDTAKYLAIGCINCCRFVDPEVILFAGGMAQAGEFLISEVRAHFAAYHWNIEPVRVKMMVAKAGTHAGVLGAAKAALDALSGSLQGEEGLQVDDLRANMMSGIEIAKATPTSSLNAAARLAARKSLMGGYGQKELNPSQLTAPTMNRSASNKRQSAMRGSMV